MQVYTIISSRCDWNVRFVIVHHIYYLLPVMGDGGFVTLSIIAIIQWWYDNYHDIKKIFF